MRCFSTLTIAAVDASSAPVCGTAALVALPGGLFLHTGGQSHHGYAWAAAGALSPEAMGDEMPPAFVVVATPGPHAVLPLHGRYHPARATHTYVTVTLPPPAAVWTLPCGPHGAAGDLAPAAALAALAAVGPCLDAQPAHRQLEQQQSCVAEVFAAHGWRAAPAAALQPLAPAAWPLPVGSLEHAPVVGALTTLLAGTGAVLVGMAAWRARPVAPLAW